MYSKMKLQIINGLRMEIETFAIQNFMEGHFKLLL